MFKHSAANANKSLEPPLPYPGATPDAERAQKPPLPEPPRSQLCPGLRTNLMPRSQLWLNLRMSLTRACSRRATVFDNRKLSLARSGPSLLNKVSVSRR